VRSDLILAVNDEPPHLALLVIQLLRLGYPVAAASSAQAVYTASKVCPELIFVDFWESNMQDMTVIQQLRIIPECADVPIIVLSTRAFSDKASEAIEAGADAYFRRPPDIEQINTILQQYLS
jgi:CheY-like chemotaxis protein